MLGLMSLEQGQAQELVERLHTFWFGELQDGVASPEQTALWFTSSDQFDQTCREGFEEALKGLTPDTWPQDAKSQLSLIILCDQIPRNIYRGTREAFAFDAIALEASKRGIERRIDDELGLDEKGFFYMPFEHSESLMDQHTAVGLFSSLRDHAPKAMKSNAGNKLRYAQIHRDVILRFGRFPHRNRALERESTPEELEFIDQGDGFGQG